MSIKIKHKDLQQACQQGIISEQQAQALWQHLADHQASKSNYTFSNLLYFAGGLIAIGALTLFLTTHLGVLGKWGLVAVVAAYWLVGLIASRVFHQKKLFTPRNICLMFVISITPLFIYSFLQALNLWELKFPKIPNLVGLLDWHSLAIELGTLMVSLVLFYFAPSSLLLLPIGLCAWVTFIDIPTQLFNHELTLNDSAKYSSLFGVLALWLGFYLDLSKQNLKRLSYWPYFFGVTALWFGLFGFFLTNEFNWIIFTLLNITLLILGILIKKSLFLIYGGVGICIYLGHLAHELFKDSVILPLVLSLIGMALVLLGVLLQKKHKQVEVMIRNVLPKRLVNYLKPKD